MFVWKCGGSAQQTRDIVPLLFQFWSTVYDAGPTLNQQWDNVSCLLGVTKNETLNRSCFNVGPASQTLSQHQTSIGSMCVVCWVARTCVLLSYCLISAMSLAEPKSHTLHTISLSTSTLRVARSRCSSCAGYNVHVQSINTTSTTVIKCKGCITSGNTTMEDRCASF